MLLKAVINNGGFDEGDFGTRERDIGETMDEPNPTPDSSSLRSSK